MAGARVEATASAAEAVRPGGRRPCQGFTLMELMVVLVVLGVMVGLATLSIGDRTGAVVEEEADRLAALLRLAQEEAILAARPLGLRVEPDRYQFLEPDGEEGWRRLQGDRMFKSRTVPEVVVLSVAVEGLERALGEEGSEDDGDAPAPHLVLLETGELTPFEITVRGEDRPRYYLLEGGLDGVIRLSQED